MIIHYLILFGLTWNSFGNNLYKECYIDGKTFPEGFKIIIQEYDIISCVCVSNNTLQCDLEDLGADEIEQCFVNGINYPLASPICTKNALSKCICISKNLMECDLFFQNNANDLQSRLMQNEGEVCVIVNKPFAVGFTFPVNLLSIINCVCLRNNTIDCYLVDSNTNPNDPGRCIVNKKEYKLGTDIETKNEVFQRCVCLANNLMQCYLSPNTIALPEAKSYFQANAAVVQSRRMQNEEVCVMDNKPMSVGSTFQVYQLNIISCVCLKSNTLDCYLGHSNPNPNYPGGCIVNKKEYKLKSDIEMKNKVFQRCVCFADDLMQCYLSPNNIEAVVQSRRMQNGEVCVIVNKPFAVGFTFPVNLLSITNCVCLSNNTIDCYLIDSKTNPNDPGKCIVHNREYKLGTDIETRNEIFQRCICLANNLMQCYLSPNTIALPGSQSKFQGRSLASSPTADEGCFIEDVFYAIEKTISFQDDVVCECICINFNAMRCVTKFIPDIIVGQRICLVLGRQYNVGEIIKGWHEDVEQCECVEKRVMICQLNYQPTG